MKEIHYTNHMHNNLSSLFVSLSSCLLTYFFYNILFTYHLPNLLKDVEGFNLPIYDI